MREFNVILADGTGMVLDAFEESDIYGMVIQEIISIEETRESIERNSPQNPSVNIKKRIISPKDIFYSSLYNKVSHTIKIIQNDKYTPTMDKQFLYGMSRTLKNGNIPTDNQVNRFTSIYNKVAI